MWTIYKLTEIATGLIYVGQTSMGLKRRIACHRVPGKLFHSKEIRAEVLATAETADEASRLEAHWTLALDAQNPSVGYNRKLVHGDPNAQARACMSEAQRRRAAHEPNPFLGRKHSDATKAKMRGPRPGLERPWLRKPVRNLDTGQVFGSLDEAAASIGLTKHAVSRVCRGKCQTAGGFHWSYD